MNLLNGSDHVLLVMGYGFTQLQALELIHCMGIHIAQRYQCMDRYRVKEQSLAILCY